jgi:hypothetical protein
VSAMNNGHAMKSKAEWWEKCRRTSLCYNLLILLLIILFSLFI